MNEDLHARVFRLEEKVNKIFSAQCALEAEHSELRERLDRMELNRVQEKRNG